MKVVQTKVFQKDLKRCKKQKLPFSEIDNVIERIKNNTLQSKHRPHKWKGVKGKKDVWELHIKGDWLLLYKKDKDILHLLRTGTHADFGI